MVKKQNNPTYDQVFKVLKNSKDGVSCLELQQMFTEQGFSLERVQHTLRQMIGKKHIKFGRYLNLVWIV